MPSHNWKNTVPSRCARCGATRVAVRPVGARAHFAGIEEKARTLAPYDYSLPDGLGALGKRPACGKGTESRHARKAGRRAKVLARSRAGSPRLRTKEALALLARLFATAPAGATLDVSTPEAPGAS